MWRSHGIQHSSRHLTNLSTYALITPCVPMINFLSNKYTELQKHTREELSRLQQIIQQVLARQQEGTTHPYSAVLGLKKSAGCNWWCSVQRNAHCCSSHHAKTCWSSYTSFTWVWWRAATRVGSVILANYECWNWKDDQKLLCMCWDSKQFPKPLMPILRVRIMFSCLFFVTFFWVWLIRTCTGSLLPLYGLRIPWLLQQHFMV